MTQRDWQKDMDFILREKERVQIFKLPTKEEDIAIYWLQEARERGEREQQLKEALELMVYMFRYDLEEGRAYMNFGDFEEVLEPDDNAAYISVSNLLRTLYPDTPAPKEGE